jgi:hypothetical protein
MWQIIFGHTYNKHSILFLKSGVREKGTGGLGRSNGLHMLVKKAGWEKKKKVDWRWEKGKEDWALTSSRSLKFKRFSIF